MVDWNVVTGEIITAVLKILIPFIFALVLKWAGDLWAKLKAQRPDLASVLEAAARTAVYAAEQLFPGDGRGEEKKAYAKEVVKRYLYERGFAVNVDVIEDVIEATVYDAFNRWKAIEPQHQVPESIPDDLQETGSEGSEEPREEPEP